MESPPISILVSRNMTSAIATQHTAVALWQLGLGLVGDRCYSFPPCLASAVVPVVREGVAFPVVRCYDSHCSIPLTEGLTGGRVTPCLAAVGHAPVVFQHDSALFCARPGGVIALLPLPFGHCLGSCLLPSGIVMLYTKYTYKHNMCQGICIEKYAYLHFLCARVYYL